MGGPQAKVLAHPWETTTWPGQSPSAAEFAGRVWGWLFKSVLLWG